MSTEKCFCHLNGFKVKDTEARKEAYEATKLASQAVQEAIASRQDTNTALENFRTQFENDCQEFTENLANDFNNALEPYTLIPEAIGKLQSEVVNLQIKERGHEERITALENGGTGGGGGGFKCYLHKIVFQMNSENPFDDGDYITFWVYSTYRYANGTPEEAVNVIRGIDAVVLSRKVGLNSQPDVNVNTDNLLYLNFAHPSTDTFIFTTFFESEIMQVWDLSFCEHQVEEYIF